MLEFIQVLELGMNFLAADDMSAILAVKLRKRLGFGVWTKLHMTGMHVEGKVMTSHIHMFFYTLSSVESTLIHSVYLLTIEGVDWSEVPS